MLDTLSQTMPQHAADFATTAPSLDALIRRPSLARRVFRGLTRFVFIFCIGVAATVAWQSYGDQGRATIAAARPELAWLAPTSMPAAQTAAALATAAPASAASELQQLKADLTQLRESLQQLKEMPSALRSEEHTSELQSRQYLVCRLLLD